jgi:hypothetical protein
VPTIRELLKTQPPSAINARVLTRTIVEHDEWFVPMLGFQGRDQFGQVVLPPDGRVGTVPGELWMFSDREAVEHAPQQLGFGSMTGVELASSLDPTWTQAQLNPGSPDYLTMQLPPLARGQLSQLARAVPLEREITAARMGALPSIAQFLSYYIALSDGQPLLLPTGDGTIARGILVFTAADAVDGLLAQIPPANQGNIQINTMAARQLFGNVAGSPIDGVLINPCGPRGAVAMGGEDRRTLLELATR